MHKTLFKYLVVPPIGTCDWSEGFPGLLLLAAGDIASEAAARENEFTFRPTTLGHLKVKYEFGKKNVFEKSEFWRCTFRLEGLILKFSNFIHFLKFM